MAKIGIISDTHDVLRPQVKMCIRDRKEGYRIQEEFASLFREEYKEKDHCPCTKACRYHGNCKECVAIHRAHQEHVPVCMRAAINKKIALLSQLTEDTVVDEIRAEQSKK